MPDNITLPGTGQDVATDIVGGKHYQRVKVDHGTDGNTTPWEADSLTGAPPVTPRTHRVRLTATPTVSTSPAYSAGDAVGGLLTFTGAVRAANATGKVEQVIVTDRANQGSDLELVLFTSTPNAPTDNAVYAPTNADLALVLGVVPLPGASALAYSGKAIRSAVLVDVWNMDLPILCAGSSLYGVLVTRGTPTYAATSDISVIVIISQD